MSDGVLGVICVGCMAYSQGFLRCLSRGELQAKLAILGSLVCVLQMSRWRPTMFSPLTSCLLSNG